MIKAWLRLFRVVNLPTVPGDILAGASVAVVRGMTGFSTRHIFAACAASVLLYLFGLVDNDIVGAKTDRGRPIPEGLVAIVTARLVRGLLLLGAVAVGVAAKLPPSWWYLAFSLLVAIVLYNRTKFAFLMGLCRGLNVGCGAALSAVGMVWAHVAVVALAWVVYTTAVTLYSEGEESDPVKKRRVGMWVTGIIYLQLAVLIVFEVRPFMLAGAVLLVLLRLLKHRLPEVSAS